MPTTLQQAPQTVHALAAQLAEGLIGHERLIERLLIALLAGGHVLIEGAPGLAKTRAVKHLAAAIEGSFARVQCTPDLMPSDVTGTPVFRPKEGLFEFVAGPIFHNIVLMDEINRAPPKVQSVMLEAMAEGQVTVANVTRRLPSPFIVVATQNPIEHEGTFPLPEAQLDRFLLHVALELPDAKTERKILDLVEAETREPEPNQRPMVMATLQDARQAAMRTHLAPELRDYIVRLVTATRRDAPESYSDLTSDIEHPVSPRGSLALASAAKARAFLHGRDHALPEDVMDLAPDALAHRLVLSWRAVADGRKSRELIADLLARVEPL
ncbi:MoxR family ATPase [Phaeobacter sp. B1627]|uniref:AAA family ATPase n=1 Tax=Phaeobacter sp. B1627 TaxID=2583809 RepID=UPI001118D695|nr:AAA family ATPase [Phaeobacter sp. B1627]TNJ47435.1 AAA family ATPase [Phaeobacter sp. B1627]